jgi:cell surface protein SprA
MEVTDARWIQFKIPVYNPENTIETYLTLDQFRFMRMFMTGFTNNVTMRFGALDLIRGDWRRFTNTLILMIQMFLMIILP